jgi:hypothetical protein
MEGPPVISTEEIYSNYEAFLSTASINTFVDLAGGDKVRSLAPKRGNQAYARRQRKKIKSIIDDMSRLQWEITRPGRGTHLGCMMFLATFTYDQKKISAFDAWKNISKDVASTKVQIKRALNADHIRTFLVKEGTLGDYPAPHMLIIVDRPVECVRYRGKKGIKYIIASRRQFEQVKRTWKNGFLDIQAVKGAKIGRRSAIAYLGKYLVKAVDVTDKESVGFRTMAWLKHYNLRTMHISSAFKEMLNPARLDTILHESQQKNSHLWVFDSVEYCDLKSFCDIIDKRRKEDDIIKRNPQLPEWILDRKLNPRDWSFPDSWPVAQGVPRGRHET